MSARTWWQSFQREAAGAARESNVTVGTQLWQLAHVGYTQGIGRSEYFRYRLWRPDLSLTERMTYTSLRERRHTESLTNPRQPGEERTSKSEMVERLERAGLPMPVLLIRVWAGTTGGSHPGDVTGPAELAERFADLATGGVVFKPEYGGQGDAVLVAPEVSRDGIVLLSGRAMDLAELWQYLSEHGPGFRVERWIEPHPDLRTFRPGSTPTMRLLTLSFGDHVVVHAATLKVPRGDSGVDNLAKGNLVAAVDLATGRVGAAVEGNGAVRHLSHPESGVPIEGEMIPHWEAVLEVGRRGARAMPLTRALGWGAA